MQASIGQCCCPHQGTPEDIPLKNPDNGLAGGCDGGAAGTVVHEGHLAKAVSAFLHVHAHVDALSAFKDLHGFSTTYGAL